MQVENAKSVKSQTNIQLGPGSTINTLLQLATSRPFEDPTEALPSQPFEISSLHVEINDKLLVELERYRIALLTSFDQATCVAAAYNLMQHQKFTSYEKRTLLLTRTDNRERAGIDIDLFTRQEYLDKTRQILLVKIPEQEEKRRFLDSLLSITSDYLHVSSIRDNLRDREMFIIVSARCDLIGLQPDRCLPSPGFLHWPVPFLLPLLQRHFPNDRARQIESQLTGQVERGLWTNLAELYETVAEQLENSPAEFEEALRHTEAGSLNLLRGPSDTENPIATLAEGRGVGAIVAYTAVYFPNLSPQDFDRIVCLLLADQTVQVEQESQIVNDKGDVLTRKEKVERRLVELWRASPDTFLRDCCLEACSRSDGTHVVEFSPPHLREKFRTVLERRFPIFLAETFACLQGTDMLFAPELSPAIADNLIRLSVERTLVDPAYYGERWLVAFVAGLRREFHTGAATDDPAAEFLVIVAQLHDAILRRNVYNRLAQLIREMLRHDALLATVRGFFEALIAKCQLDGVLDILLELVKRLRFAPRFDGFRWLKRLLDEGSEDIRDQTYLCLLELAADSGVRIFDFLESIHAWLPEADKEETRYSFSNRYALRLIVNYSHSSLCAVSPASYGEWPSRCTLFAALPRNKRVIEERVGMIVRWLLHPGIPKAIDPDDSEITERYLWFLGDFIEICFLVLEGPRPADAHVDARLPAESLVHALQEQLGSARHAELVRYWQMKQDAYAQIAIVTPRTLPAAAKKRRLFLAKRNILLTLRRRLNQTSTRPSPNAREARP